MLLLNLLKFVLLMKHDFLLKQILFQETDFNLRRTAIRFLTALLTNCTKELQDIILESGPMGVSKLVDLLQDEREVIRNDV